MMNLIYDDFPSSVMLNGVERKIVTDFKDWIRFADMLRDEALGLEDKVEYILDFYMDELPASDWAAAVKPLLDFFKMIAADPDNAPDTGIPENVPELVEKKALYDFAFDARYIIAGFLHDYGIDITAVNMHWWRFRILLDGLSADTEFKQRVMYRNTNASKIKDVNERQRIQRIQRSIAIPQQHKPDDYEIGGMFW